MKPQINMIGIVTHNFDAMKEFYSQTLGFAIQDDRSPNYVEFIHEGVRFALSTGAIMAKTTGEESYTKKPTGHSFELAFSCDTPEAVNEDYKTITQAGATPIQPPADMPWGQRTAFFADPDGNIHELFANL